MLPLEFRVLLVSGPFEILDDTGRTFASSDFVRLEVLPKAIHYNYAQEKGIYEAYFSRVSIWAEASAVLVSHAYQLALEHGLAAMDAIHIASARSVGADEFITCESPSKPIHRVTLIRVKTIF